MINKKSVASIIVTYNGSMLIKKCIESLINSSIESDIYIYDNHSLDNTVDIIKEYFPYAFLYTGLQNIGFGKGNNILLREAKKKGYKYYFLINQDATIESDTIKNMINISRENGDYGILSPLHFSNNFLLDKKFEIYLKNAKNINSDILRVEKVNAAIWLITDECLTTVGLFSPVFAHYGEDWNFIHRCNYWRYKVGIAYKTHGYHYRSQNTKMEYERYKHRLQTTLLTYSMNINFPFILCYMYILIIFIRKILSGIIKMDYRKIYNSIQAFSNIHLKLKKILLNRKKTLEKSAYLNEDL